MRREMLAPFEEEEKKRKNRTRERHRVLLLVGLVCLLLFVTSFVVWSAAPKSCVEVERTEVHGYCPEASPEEEDACLDRLRVEHWMETECSPMEPYNRIFWAVLSAAILVLIVFYVYLLMGTRRRTTTMTCDWRERIGYEPHMGHPDYDG